jgi:hypothetical protein
VAQSRSIRVFLLAKKRWNTDFVASLPAYLY